MSVLTGITLHERLLKQTSKGVLLKLVSMCDLIKMPHMRVVTRITLRERLTSIIFHERLLKNTVHELS